MEKPQATAVVAAMQDRARLDWVLARGEDEMPNLLLNWLWFRRYTLAYPERCTRQEAQCHILRAEGRSKWALTEAEYPALLRGQSLDHPWIKDPFRVPGLPGSPSLVPTPWDTVPCPRASRDTVLYLGIPASSPRAPGSLAPCPGPPGSLHLIDLDPLFSSFGPDASSSA